MRTKNRIQIVIIGLIIGFQIQAVSAQNHPCLIVNNKDRQEILSKIEQEEWAQKAWESLKQNIDPYVDRHQSDPEWIVSRLAMYWKDGEHFTQCYIKNQNWDYGEGNAPMPTVRLPGMRTWNNFINVPLEDRLAYSESGDMLGIDRSSDDKSPVLVPYKESGHMVRINNNEILKLAEDASFAFWLTQEEKYAKFSADILWTWLLGTYYMNPPLDPEESTKGPGGYEPGGIMGYYDYEVIHDDGQISVAVAFDFLHDYMNKNPHPQLDVIGKTSTQLTGEVLKRFIEIGLIRGGRSGNWNVNRYKNIINSILVLESNDFYEDGKGKEFYIPYYTEIASDYHAPLPEIMDNYDKVTGLWPESPGYASGMIPTVLQMGMRLYKSGVNTMSENPMIQKAAMANMNWLDARGNLVVFGDMRGGPFPFNAFENLLTYYTWEGDDKNAVVMASIILKGIEAGQYDRTESGWAGLCLFQKLPESGTELPYKRAVYSRFHRHLIMKNGNSEENGLMFTLYGGKKGSHLAENGLTMQFYGKGWALAPDASAYESYWSDDSKYHRGIGGSNTIVPGYTQGDITLNAMDPFVDTTSLYNKIVTSFNCSFADVSAKEKRRLVAMVRTSPTTGYYVDIFRSDQDDNDYIYHNLGNTAVFKDGSGKMIELQKVDTIGVHHHPSYSFFKSPRKTSFSSDFWATWSVTAVSPALNVDMWMMGQKNREIYLVDAPPTTLRSDLTPGRVNKSPQTTPTMILRQSNNAWANPFVAVFEPYTEGEKSISDITKFAETDSFISIAVKLNNNTRQIILNAIDKQIYKPEKNIIFQGIFGITSEKEGSFEYLYLGKGKVIQKGKYRIEAVEGEVTAELRMVDGQVYYSSDNPVRISVKEGKTKEYPAGYNIAID